MLNSDLSPAAPQVGREPPTYKTGVVSTRRRSRQTGSPAEHCNHPLSRSNPPKIVPSDFLVDGLVNGLETVHPFSPYASLAHGFFLFMLCLFQR